MNNPNAVPYVGPNSAMATRRLKSCGLTPTTVTRESWKRYLWKSHTDKGMRFVEWDGERWKITKDPPCS